MKIEVNENKTSALIVENSVSALPISINIDKNFFVENIEHILHVSDEVTKITPILEKLARDAFFRKNDSAWNKIQNILYIWNVQDLFRLNSRKFEFTLNMLLRNKIIEIENESLNHSVLSSFKNFNPDLAIKELSEKANTHRINHHPLLVHMNKHGLSQQAVKIFLENYYVNNRVFHLFVAQQSLATPMEMRVEMYKNLFDELGTGDQDMAHPILFLKNFDTIGHPKIIEPFSETLHLFNTKYYASTLSGDYHYGTGGLGFIEITMPKQMRMILNGLRKSNIPERDLEFWRVHITIDEVHGKAWFDEMRELIHTSEQAEQCLNGGLRLIEARAKMYDGIWNHLVKHNMV